MAVLVGLAVALLVGVLLAGTLARRIDALRRTALHVAELGPVAEAHDRRRRRPTRSATSARALATMQDRLREQEEARRAFVSTASHELRTPLAALRRMLELLARRPRARTRPPGATRPAQVTACASTGGPAGALADELLDLSRLDAGVELRRELVELGELARAVAAEFAPAPRERDVELDAGAAAGAVLGRWPTRAPWRGSSASSSTTRCASRRRAAACAWRAVRGDGVRSSSPTTGPASPTTSAS